MLLGSLRAATVARDAQIFHEKVYFLKYFWGEGDGWEQSIPLATQSHLKDLDRSIYLSKNSNFTFLGGKVAISSPESKLT